MRCIVRKEFLMLLLTSLANSSKSRELSYKGLNRFEIVQDRDFTGRESNFKIENDYHIFPFLYSSEKKAFFYFEKSALNGPIDIKAF